MNSIISTIIINNNQSQSILCNNDNNCQCQQLSFDFIYVPRVVNGQQLVLSYPRISLNGITLYAYGAQTLKTR